MTFWQLAGYVGVSLVALAVVLTFVMALASKAGRDALAVIGVRVADALVAFFERWLSTQHGNRRAFMRQGGGRVRQVSGHLVMGPWWKD